MVEVVGGAGSGAGPSLSLLDSLATHVWREEEKAGWWLLQFEWKKKEEKGKGYGGRASDPENSSPFTPFPFSFFCV